MPARFEYARERRYLGAAAAAQSQARALCCVLQSCTCGPRTCVPFSAVSRRRCCPHLRLLAEDSPDAATLGGGQLAAWGSDGALATHELPYAAGGLLRAADTHVYECGPSCTCSEDCPLRVVSRGMRTSLDVVETAGGRGWGVRARAAVRRHAFLCEYVGEVITDREANARGRAADARGVSYILEIDSQFRDAEDGEEFFSIDAERFGNVARFINHACEPNVETRSVLVEHSDARLAHVALFASRDIDAGEEIFLDYGYDNRSHSIGRAPLANDVADLYVPEGFETKALDLSGSVLCSTSMRTLARTIAVMSTLETLDLSGSLVGDAGAIELAEALKETKSPLSFIGMAAVADALAATRAPLATLKLGNNLFGDAGAVALAQALKCTDAPVKQLDDWVGRSP